MDNNKHGYLFDMETMQWIQLDIELEKNSNVSFPRIYSLFSYRKSIYVKGKQIYLHCLSILLNASIIISYCAKLQMYYLK